MERTFIRNVFILTASCTVLFSAVSYAQLTTYGGGHRRNNVNHSGGTLDFFDSYGEAIHNGYCYPDHTMSSNRLTWCNGDAPNDYQAFLDNYTRPLRTLPLILTRGIRHVTEALPGFIDASIHLKAQREMQKLQAQAHIDYHPSETICAIGTVSRGLMTADEKARDEKIYMNKVLMDTYLNKQRMASTSTPQTNPGDTRSDYDGSRIVQFRTTYCDPADHSGGLDLFCQHDLTDPAITAGEQIGGPAHRRNNDINYNRLFLSKLTLDLDFTDDTAITNPPRNDGYDDHRLSEDEEDVLALARNLYWPEDLEIIDETRLLDLRTYRISAASRYLSFRHAVAIQNVAHNSFITQASMKASIPEDRGGRGDRLKAFLRVFDLTVPEIEGIMGAEPSYQAYMDVLTKKMYQTPNFYTNLYDKPANVKRINAAMEAIRVMHLRDRYQTSQRREILAALLVETGLQEQIMETNAQIVDLLDTR